MRQQRIEAPLYRKRIEAEAFYFLVNGTSLSQSICRLKLLPHIPKAVCFPHTFELCQLHVLFLLFLLIESAARRKRG